MNQQNPIKEYLPVLGMLLATVLQVLYVALQDNVVTGVEALNLFIALVGAVTLYVVPRFPGVLWLKPVVAAITAALMVFADAMLSVGISPQTWVMAGIQFLVGLGIVAATNKNVPLTLPKAA